MTFATLTREGISLADTAGLKYSLGSGRPTTLRKFAENLGVDRVELREMDEDAMLVKRPDGISLFLNREHPKVRHRFSMAHELAHLLLEPVIGDRAIHRRRFVPHQDPDGQKIEEICNRMASAVLMPTNYIKQILQRTGYTAKCVPEIAHSFQVSFEAAGRRYISVIPRPSAMLFSRRNHKGQIQQARRPIVNEALGAINLEMRYEERVDIPSMANAFEVDEMVMSKESAVISSRVQYLAANGRLVTVDVESFGRGRGAYRQITSFVYLPAQVINNLQIR